MNSSDKYYESIDFSNHCRKFYIERLKAADDIKEKVQKESDTGGKKEDQSSAISSAMAKLRAEMASLMDQDISLMRQLLTLNETIEEIKQKRMYGVSKDSLRASSVDLSFSSESVSETDMFSNDEEERPAKLNTAVNVYVICPYQK
ncbi:hypothetical protein KUTeg_016972 [Tegillarca granosa]|uniref:Uncharacterized protein n=1 Tax=Tegillarca granosa TaxID=220873 RepID=A0ABQ9EMD7_TEGGR|nr:hypothetical protein KUTeg_016972 [Tegillarca granosa]